MGAFQQNPFAIVGHQVFSFDDLVAMAVKAGFAGMAANIAAAIALAESSGNPDAIGDLSLGVSVGLWQINLKAHPHFTRFGLLKPQNNANAAFEVYRDAKNSFSPWSTYNSGAYLKHMPSNAPVPPVGTAEKPASPVHPASVLKTKPVSNAPAEKSATSSVPAPAPAPAPAVEPSLLERIGHALVDALPIIGQIIPLIPFPESGIVGKLVTETGTILEEKEKK